MRVSVNLSVVALGVGALVSTGAPHAQTQVNFDSANHGSAAVSTSGAVTTVTTTNGTGTNYSSLNWGRFSIAAGDTVHFQQPQLLTGTSVSINRIVDPNPSVLAGTLSSNGRLILVNPFGITVSAGAVVDTAGFTASTVNASDTELLAAGFGTRRDLAGPAAPIDIQGRIVARAGDVILVGGNLTQRGAIEAMGTALEGGQVVLRALNTLQAGGQVLARVDPGTGAQSGQIELLGAQVTLESGADLRSGTIAITAEDTAPAITFQGAQVTADQGTLTVTAGPAGTVSLEGANRLWGSAGTTLSAGTTALRSGASLQTTGLSAGGVARRGTLAVAGDLQVESGATLHMAVGNGGSDQITVSGVARFAGPSSVSLDFLPGTDTLNPGSYKLIDGATSPPPDRSAPGLTGASVPAGTTLKWGSLLLDVPPAASGGGGGGSGGGGGDQGYLDGLKAGSSGPGSSGNRGGDTPVTDMSEEEASDC